MQQVQLGRSHPISALTLRAPKLSRPAVGKRPSGRRACVVPQAINKTELVEAVSSVADHVPKAAVSDVVDTLFDTIVNSVADEEPVNITGFGKFEVRYGRRRWQISF